MPSVEQLVKDQYAKLFSVGDWPLFKEAAEALLQEAAHIKTVDMGFSTTRKLLARNSRKRCYSASESSYYLNRYTSRIASA
jgi:hypothetical protein